MPHWSDVYPHQLHASVILKNNKIKLWKVGDRKLSQSYVIDELIRQRPEYSYQEKAWTVFNQMGHNRVFEKHAPNWFKQWELHEEFSGFSPWE